MKAWQQDYARVDRMLFIAPRLSERLARTLGRERTFWQVIGVAVGYIVWRMFA